MKELIYFILKKSFYSLILKRILYLFYTEVGMADMIFNLIYC